MQELPNAPWNTTGGDEQQEGGGMSRADYIAFVKNQELMEQQEKEAEEKANAMPPKLQPVQVSEIGVQVDPPPVNVGT